MTETNKEAAAKIARGRAVLLITQRFWGVLAMQLALREDCGIPTMATDGESIFYSPDFVMSLSDAEIRGVLAHEVEHVARLHHTRRGRRDPERWNMAADYAINPGLLAGGFKLPEGGLVDDRFVNMTSEAIYAQLAKEENARPQSPQQAQGKPAPGAGPPQPGQGASPPPAGAGSASGQKPARSQGGFGQVMDAPGGEAGKAAAEMKAETAVRQAAAIAKKEGAGHLPGFVEEILRDLDKPRVDWRQALRRFADDSAIKETAWTRPNRRYPPPLILPGKQSAACAKIVGGIDCSGSIDLDALRAFGGESQAMLDEGCCDHLTAVYFDTRVHRSEDYDAGDMVTLKATGRGGTSFAPVLSWIAAEHPDAAAIVFLTDLDASDWQDVKDPGIPVLWAATGPWRPSNGVPFGEIVQIDAHLD